MSPKAISEKMKIDIINKAWSDFAADPESTLKYIEKMESECEGKKRDSLRDSILIYCNGAFQAASDAFFNSTTLDERQTNVTFMTEIQATTDRLNGQVVDREPARQEMAR